MSTVQLPYDQLLNWTIAKGKVPTDGIKRLVDVEQKCKECVRNTEELPPAAKAICNVVVDDGTVDWYELIKNLVDTLKESEQGKRTNIFGQYSFGPLYNADKLLRLYQRYNLHIVAYCQMLHKNVTYNAPYLRNAIESAGNEIANCNSQITESARKYKSYFSDSRERLKRYNLPLSQFPPKEELKEALLANLQDNVIKAAVGHLTECYYDTSSILQKVYPEVSKIFVNLVKMHGIKKSYNDNSFAVFKHASENALKHGKAVVQPNSETPQLIELDPNEPQDPTEKKSANEDTPEQEQQQHQRQQQQVSTVSQANVDEAVSLQVEEDDKVDLDKDDYIFLFKTFLGDPLYRQLLLADLREILAFVDMRITQVGGEAESLFCMLMELDPEYQEIISTPKTKLLQYKADLDVAVNYLTDAKTLNMYGLLKSKEKLVSHAKREIDPWLRCINEINEQARLENRIKALNQEVEKYKNDLEELRKRTCKIKERVQFLTADVVGENVTIFGEIDYL